MIAYEQEVEMWTAVSGSIMQSWQIGFTDVNGYPLPTYPAGFYPVGWGFGKTKLPMGMQMVKSVYPVGIVGVDVV